PEFGTSNRTWRTTAHGVTVDEIVSMLAERVGSNGPDLVSQLESFGASLIATRRRLVLGLVRQGRVEQRELAGRLGVSVRTVRNDITELRKQGLLEIPSAN